ncbi:MAG: HEAT repeat domain-containing protein [Deltaproteobacteria bacterium]|nr:HEAT repeat domain-containing protein [Deltaproteobacteria bacterium]MBW1952855.1 HEAT repeat domain-containing protein [Deltaproteobacteria bacterium]MBW1985853.1 HEAT repeat domain-containing protein [Deltaproteobacteria bacterium]MBW2133613.1 HEAT repeat domain-containing protein [Deltaproteobacteria bacterium]
MTTKHKIKREKVTAYLLNGDFASLVELAGREPVVSSILLQLTFALDDPLSWRAVEGLGYLAEAHPERVKTILGRLWWLLNEDSGSFGWGAPAVLGEIGRRNYSLVADTVEMLFSYLDEEFSRSPMLWGLGRMGQTHPEIVREAIPQIMEFLHDADPQVRGHAAWCLGVNGAGEGVGPLARLASDAEPVKLYENGELRQTTVGEIAREALARLES